MSLEGPQLRYARVDDVQGDEANTLEKALDLARRLEELLEDTRSVAVGPAGIDEARAHSTRMARAMAASLVDELENLTKATQVPTGSGPRAPEKRTAGVS